jgi:hypothetical protein
MRCNGADASRQEPLDAGSDRTMQQRLHADSVGTIQQLVRIGPYSSKNNIIQIWYSLLVMEGDV